MPLTMLRKACALLLLSTALTARQPDISAADVAGKVAEIMQAHAQYKEMSPLIMRRTLSKCIEELDPGKTYFIRSDIQAWLEPSDQAVSDYIAKFKRNDFSVFEQIHLSMVKAIERRRSIEKELDKQPLPVDVKPNEFKDMKWTADLEALKSRLLRLRGLQAEAAEKLSHEQKTSTLQRIHKRRLKYEEELLINSPQERQRLVYSNLLKAVACSLDAHTAYFTPAEASQFMINLQQRLFGIGAQLRDDLNGFTVVKVIEGGPAAKGDALKAKDRIIAVNGEPVVGMEITDAVELIRGPEGSTVTVTVIRPTGDEKKPEETLQVPLVRGEVVLKESRLESSVEPFGDGSIAYLHLFSFYQDPENSSALDITKELAKLRQENNIKGVVLDLRYNAGGMLSQAVAVTGLFISRGVVVSIKDDKGKLQHLRDLDGKSEWDGPLIVMTNRASASAAEIVAQTLQDYGRAIIVGDDHTFGKGTFQTFTLNSSRGGEVNPKGEYKVTRGTYYTVSGRSPQKQGLKSDIVVPGALSHTDIGEQYSDYALDAAQIQPLFDDQLLDVPEAQRQRLGAIYRSQLQPVLKNYTQVIPQLAKNSQARISSNKGYQQFLENLGKDEVEKADMEPFENVDFQLTEAYSIMKDLLLLLKAQK